MIRNVYPCTLKIRPFPCFPLEYHSLQPAKSAVYERFTASTPKNQWLLGGIYRHVFRGYRRKNGIFTPSLSHTPKPCFVRPVHKFCPSTLSVQLSFHPRKSPLYGTKKGDHTASLANASRKAFYLRSNAAKTHSLPPLPRPHEISVDCLITARFVMIEPPPDSPACSR